MSASTITDAEMLDGNQITRWSIWGDDAGFQVFAEAFCRGLRVVFRFSTDPTLRQSIQSRIVTCYHENLAADATETFANMDTMREAVWSSIDKVWDSCSNHPSIIMPDVVVEIYEDGDGRLQWRLSHLSIYNDYLQQLRPLDKVLNEKIPLDAYENFDAVEFSSLTCHGRFVGRGTNKLVGLPSEPDSLFVFKGLDLAKFLMAGSNFPYWRDDCYHEIRTIRSLLPHPNIISPAIKFVTASEISEEPGQAYICGTLSPYMKNGNLNDQVNRARHANYRLTLAEKAKWCFQMASAIAHTHHTCETYHKDIRPSNFLIDFNRDLILIDWEQSGAPLCTIAPEADGSSDIVVQPDSPYPKPLVYKRCNVPERVNHPSSWPHRDVFPIWKNECPEALEAAEVYSLGRTMWMLLEQVDEGSPDDEVVMAYWEQQDIPEGWKAVVNLCLESDPNKRVRLSELVSYWEAVRGMKSDFVLFA